jgi:hypothetical protein
MGMHLGMLLIDTTPQASAFAGTLPARHEGMILSHHAAQCSVIRSMTATTDTQDIPVDMATSPFRRHASVASWQTPLLPPD